MNWMLYHISEDYFIALICSIIAFRAFEAYRAEISLGEDKRSRMFIFGTAFVLLGLSSLIHASIHSLDLNPNILYQTLLGYCFGLLTLIVALSSENPVNKKAFGLLYIPMLVLLFPQVHESFPLFTEFRPIAWMVVSYLSGIICMIYIASFYHTKNKRYLFSSLGHVIMCFSAIILFFPASIGSETWIYGHVIRPVGFGVLFFSVTRKELIGLRSSFLYRALTAFALLSAIPLLVFGFFILYENINPVQVMDKRAAVFFLLLITLTSALLFSLGMIIRLIKPILHLKESVVKLVDEGLNSRIEVKTRDEIGELSEAFNDMVVKLKNALADQDRLSRLAASGELAATLAHEIKNPLNAISGAASYIEKNYRGSLIREFLKIIDDEALRINKLTTTLLSFAKPVKPEPAPEDINKLVRETVLLMEQEARERNAIIETDLAADMPIVSFDYDQLKQVIINLLVNSLDAVKENGRIMVRSFKSDGNVYVSIKDNGAGISEDDMKNIFNPFFTTKTRGTGLGLSISKKIAKEHGGDLTVESVDGKGSSFTVVLPAAR